LNVLFEIFNKTFDCCLFCCYYCLPSFLVFKKALLLLLSVSHAISSLVPDCKIQQDRLLQSHNVLPPSLQEQSASKSKWGFIFLDYSLPQVIKLINYTNHVSDLKPFSTIC